MEAFVCHQNIDHYQRLLEATTDEGERRAILGLLAAEEAKLKQMMLKDTGAPNPANEK